MLQIEKGASFSYSSFLFEPQKNRLLRILKCSSAILIVSTSTAR